MSTKFLFLWPFRAASTTALRALWHQWRLVTSWKSSKIWRSTTNNAISISNTFLLMTDSSQCAMIFPRCILPWILSPETSMYQKQKDSIELSRNDVGAISLWFLLSGFQSKWSLNYYIMSSSIWMHFHGLMVSPISDLSPTTIIKGMTVNYNLHFRMLYSEYAQTRDAIAMGPNKKMQGGVSFFSLTTGRIIDKSGTDFTLLPMPRPIWPEMPLRD